jgi:hypothetical protein
MVTVVSTPVILRLAVQDSEPGAEQLMGGEKSKDRKWDYPPTLALLKSSEGDLIYDIVGQIFFNGSHYCARFRGYRANSEDEVYEYDGMKLDGYCQKIEGGSIGNHLCGPETLLLDRPAGFRTCMTVYRLRGGYQSQ